MQQGKCSAELLTKIHDFLLRQGYPHHRQLHVSAERNVVRVAGLVPSFYLRQVAVESIKRVPGVERVIDEIRVGACGEQLFASSEPLLADADARATLLPQNAVFGEVDRASARSGGGRVSADG